jgi:hypothetical protein
MKMNFPPKNCKGRAMTQALAAKLIPSTDWQEVIASDEEQRYARFAQEFAELQARKSEKFGDGRALHRKQITAAKATLEVLADLPVFATQGLFAKPGQFDVLVRLSNGGMDKSSDRKKDIRGFSLRVLGVQGESALGNGPAISQDFTLINNEAFAFSGSEDFVGFVVAASQGGGALFKYLFKRYGVFGAFKQMKQMAKAMGKPFSGFATENMYSAVPMACGPYAVRVRLVPSPENGQAVPGAEANWDEDFSARMAQKDLSWDLQLQPFVSETLTPIEDASINWTSEYVTVARLRIPSQKSDSAEGEALSEQVDRDAFDPWQAMAAHRPLGDVQRARKVVYFQSQNGRSKK